MSYAITFPVWLNKCPCFIQPSWNFYENWALQQPHSQEWMSHGKSFLWMLLTPGSGDDRHSKCSHPLPPKGEEPQYQLPRLLFTNTIPRRFQSLPSPPFINIILDLINLPAMVFLLPLTNTDTDLFNTWFGLKIVQLSVGKLISWRFSAN